MPRTPEWGSDAESYVAGTYHQAYTVSLSSASYRPILPWYHFFLKYFSINRDDIVHKQSDTVGSLSTRSVGGPVDHQLSAHCRRLKTTVPWDVSNCQGLSFSFWFFFLFVCFCWCCFCLFFIIYIYWNNLQLIRQLNDQNAYEGEGEGPMVLIPSAPRVRAGIY